MKFMPKEPLTFQQATRLFCFFHESCNNCPIKSVTNCFTWLKTHKKEAVELMKDLFVCFDEGAVYNYRVEYPQQTLAHQDENGNWVLNDSTPKVEAIQQAEKLLSEWTLQEVIDLCDKTSCKKEYCPFKVPCTQAGFTCELQIGAPMNWNLQPKPRFSKQDVEDAKAIKRIFPWVVSILAVGVGLLELSDNMVCNSQTMFIRRNKLFSTVKANERIRINDILESEVVTDEQKEN